MITLYAYAEEKRFDCTYDKKNYYTICKPTLFTTVRFNRYQRLDLGDNLLLKSHLNIVNTLKISSFI